VKYFETTSEIWKKIQAPCLFKGSENKKKLNEAYSEAINNIMFWLLLSKGPLICKQSYQLYHRVGNYAQRRTTVIFADYTHRRKLIICTRSAIKPH